MLEFAPDEASDEQRAASVGGRWFITPHAVTRYIERYRPNVSREQALTELVWWSEIATEHCRTSSGEAQYNVEFPVRIRFVVTTQNRHGDLPTLLTVLPANRRRRWLNLPLDVSIQFAQFASRDDRDERLESLLPQWLAKRRAEYAHAKFCGDIGRRVMLERARKRSAARWKIPEQREMMIAGARLVHTIRRKEEVIRRPPCPECGRSIELIARMGRVRKYCSVKCNHRAASRAWWQRRRANDVSSAG